MLIPRLYKLGRGASLRDVRKRKREKGKDRPFLSASQHDRGATPADRRPEDRLSELGPQHLYSRTLKVRTLNRHMSQHGGVKGPCACPRSAFPSTRGSMPRPGHHSARLRHFLPLDGVGGPSRGRVVLSNHAGWGDAARPPRPSQRTQTSAHLVVWCSAVWKASHSAAPLCMCLGRS